MSIAPVTACPFCGQGPEKCYAEEVQTDRWTVICSRCGANGPLDLNAENTKARAVQAWDTRPPSRFDRALDEALNSGDGSYRP